MDPIENLHSLHDQEEGLRGRNLATIAAREDLRDHLAIVAEAMNVIFAFVRDHEHQSEDELTLQLFGIRLFNAAGASIKLALSGYYQKAFDQVRDVIETGFLVDYLRIYPEKIAEWTATDKRQRQNTFGPDAVRRALDKHYGHEGEERRRIYGLISDNASHPSYQGFNLVATGDQNLGAIGPFFDEKKLAAWLQELAKRFVPAALSLSMTNEGQNVQLAIARLHYCEVIEAWRRKYVQPQDDPQPAERSPG